MYDGFAQSNSFEDITLNSYQSDDWQFCIWTKKVPREMKCTIIKFVGNLRIEWLQWFSVKNHIIVLDLDSQNSKDNRI